MNAPDIRYYARLIHDLADHFGPSTELVVHDLRARDPEHSIVAIEHGEITGRKIGDGPSKVVIEALRSDPDRLTDRLSYLTKTETGKLLKSSTIYLRGNKGEVIGILGINTDITLTMAMEQYLHAYHALDVPGVEPEQITTSVTDLLDTLIQQSISLVGKPVALMSKDEKVRAIRFLNDRGAFLITKSGPKISQVFGISKYTLYSYLDEAKQES